MTRKNLKIFLDTSVLFSAVLSQTGGARKFFHLAEAGLLQLIVGPTVLREADEVVRRKSPASLPLLAQLLEAGQVETCSAPTLKQIESARSLVAYIPDARVLAEAIRAEVDWFVTHDKEHFLKAKMGINLSFEIGTPGDLLQSFKDDFYLP
ncbi:MAG: PIN domain-containing protein [Anaerolineales bacterium]|nr:PIN domain-containing protein [Anaerolineales bacterium]MDP2776201.1 PIN domain-containing protein [Anaerolineales bacterium]